jgi:hypothetical protein
LKCSTSGGPYCVYTIAFIKRSSSRAGKRLPISQEQPDCPHPDIHDGSISSRASGRVVSCARARRLSVPGAFGNPFTFSILMGY